MWGDGPTLTALRPLADAWMVCRLVEGMMETTILGRTGLEVTVMGFGCGGPSRAGQSTGHTEAESVKGGIMR